MWMHDPLSIFNANSITAERCGSLSGPAAEPYFWAGQNLTDPVTFGSRRRNRPARTARAGLL
ncbi:hypothetical protein LUTEI9C_10232 [Luteimonas sp. 9C]|nr:hypothetical protein LUTEI9C_10232 [Luteimonas sp. 9C]